ncbi:MAG: hypothetical protein Q9157_008858 [Trypethelium eluteriae]
MAYKNQKAKKRASRAQASKKDSNSRDGGQSPMQNRPKCKQLLIKTWVVSEGVTYPIGRPNRSAAATSNVSVTR